MPRFRVRQGMTLAAWGEVMSEGTYVTLPLAIASDIAVAPCIEAVDAQGHPLSMTEAVTDVDLALSVAQRHEHISILTAERERVSARLAQLDGQIAVEMAWNAEQNARLSTLTSGGDEVAPSEEKE